jgi:hypothetical protein
MNRPLSYAPWYVMRESSMQDLYEMPINELHFLILIVSEDWHASGSQFPRTGNHCFNSKEVFRAFMRISLQKRGIAQTGESNLRTTFFLRA